METLRSEGVRWTTTRSAWCRRPPSKRHRWCATERRRATTAKGPAATPASESELWCGTTEWCREAASIWPIPAICVSIEGIAMVVLVAVTAVEAIANLSTSMGLVAVVRGTHVCCTRASEMAVVRRPQSTKLVRGAFYSGASVVHNG